MAATPANRSLPVAPTLSPAPPTLTPTPPIPYPTFQIFRKRLFRCACSFAYSRFISSLVRSLRYTSASISCCCNRRCHSTFFSISAASAAAPRASSAAYRTSASAWMAAAFSYSPWRGEGGRCTWGRVIVWLGRREVASPGGSTVCR